MSPPIKAALLSALVLPGAGHMYLKKTARAVALFITVFIALWIIISDAVAHANKIVNQMLTQGTAIDLNNISQISAQAAQNYDDTNSNLALVVLLICWFFAIVDSYRLGKTQQQSSK